jgi:hypothetical protein
LVKVVDVERQPLTADVELKVEDVSQLHSCLTKRLTQSPPPANATIVSERK